MKHFHSVPQSVLLYLSYKEPTLKAIAMHWY